VVGLASNGIPRRDCPVAAPTSGGGTILKYGLQDGVIAGGLNRVEQENNLAV
jgi:hypothetical protein